MKINRLLGIVCGLFPLFTFTAHAATTNSWKSATSGKWETAANWSVHAPAASDDREMITNTATKTVTIDATTATLTNTLTINGLYIAGTATSTNTLALINAGTTTPLQVFNGTVIIETNAALVISGSALVVDTSSTSLQIGNQGGHSSLVISNSGSIQSYVGRLGGSNNTVTVTGPGSGWQLLNNFIIGTFGTGNTLRVSNGGTVSVPNTAVSEVGVDPASRSNVVIVTDPGSVWHAGEELVLGTGGSGNTLTITNGGLVFDNVGIVGDGVGTNNLLTITGTGSVMSNSIDFFLGVTGPSNRVIVTDGGKLIFTDGIMGDLTNTFNNTLTVTGPGSVCAAMFFNIGAAGASNTVTITNGGLLSASSRLTVGTIATSSNNLLQVSGGSLLATNAFGTCTLTVGPGGFQNSLVLDSGTVTVDDLVAPSAGSGIISLNGGTLTVHDASIANGLDFIIGGTNTSATYIASGGTQYFQNNFVVQRGTFTMNGGLVTVSQFVLANGANSVAALNSGEFATAGTFVTNGAQFVIGNGVAHANFYMTGGVHNFSNGLRISNGASLTGCGTVNGDVTIDAGGSVFTTCGMLTFTGTVINNGALAANGATLEFYGPVINNNGLLFYNGGTTNFHGTFMNNAIITNAGPVIITSITRTGNNVIVTAPSALDFDYQLQIANTVVSPIWTNSGPIQPGTGSPLTFTDPSGATNAPNRFYQIDVIWPP